MLSYQGISFGDANAAIAAARFRSDAPNRSWTRWNKLYDDPQMVQGLRNGAPFDVLIHRCYTRNCVAAVIQKLILSIISKGRNSEFESAEGVPQLTLSEL